MDRKADILCRLNSTGGTIAGSSKSNTDSTAYTAGAIGVAALVEAVPELLTTAQIDGVQVSNVGSNVRGPSWLTPVHVLTCFLLIVSHRCDRTQHQQAR